MKTFRVVLKLLLMLVVCPKPCFGQLTVFPIFSDGVVLQRDQVLPIWGTTGVGDEVTIMLKEARISGLADSLGNWRIELPAFQAGGPFKMTIATSSDEITITDIYVGDVWIAGGQSNMKWQLDQSDGGAEAIASANDQEIRHFKVPEGFAFEPSETWSSVSTWLPTTPQYAGIFSGVAFYFAEELKTHVDVPIGILNLSFNSSRIEAWMSEEMLGFDEEDVELSDGALARQPTLIYNRMVHPILSFPIKGMLWYQGESNATTPRDAFDYEYLFQSFIVGWRTAWGQPDMPVI